MEEDGSGADDGGAKVGSGCSVLAFATRGERREHIFPGSKSSELIWRLQRRSARGLGIVDLKACDVVWAEELSRSKDSELRNVESRADELVVSSSIRPPRRSGFAVK